GEAKLQCWVCSDYRDQNQYAQISNYGRQQIPKCDDDVGSENYGVLIDVVDPENHFCTVFHRNDEYGKVVLRGFSSKANLQNTFGIDEPECREEVRFPQLSQERFFLCACQYSMCNRNSATGNKPAASVAAIALISSAIIFSFA
ncbi:unnamed protein product, partial [Notodromas monacha]